MTEYSENEESREVPVTNQLTVSGKDFSHYSHDGNFIVFFKLVHNRAEVDEDIRDGTFFPDFVHQFFINKEKVFGYKKPVLRLFYSASRLKRYVKFDYEDKLTREEDGIEADDFMGYLSPILEDLEYTHDLNHFITDVDSKEEKDFKPPGDLLHEFEISYKKRKILSRAEAEQLEMSGESESNGNANGISKLKTNGTSASQNGHHAAGPSVCTHITNGGDKDATTCKKNFQIFHANVDTKNFAQFQARMQTLVMWFIESATMIDYEDPHWDFFLIFERFNPSTSEDPNSTTVSTEDRFYFAGYATVYRYYAYPDKTRPRVSQMILLPPYRRNGLGTTLLQSIYDYYLKQPATLDITAEDPDEEFIAMRDFLDCKNCLKLDSYQPDKLKEGWSEEKAKEAQEKLKLCQRQARKVYEILRLKYLNFFDEDEYKKYRLEVKNRLNAPNRRLILDCIKVEKQGHKLPEDLQNKIDNQKLALAALNENYQELEKQYQHTIDKFNNAITC